MKEIKSQRSARINLQRLHCDSYNRRGYTFELIMINKGPNE